LRARTRPPGLPSRDRRADIQLAARIRRLYPFMTVRDPSEPNMSKKIIRTYRSLMYLLPIFPLLVLVPDSGPLGPVMALLAVVFILFNWLDS
jgi:hypothetical protein